jgi:hypothetical protein
MSGESLSVTAGVTRSRSALGAFVAFGSGMEEPGGDAVPASRSIPVEEYVDGWLEYGAREEEK